MKKNNFWNMAYKDSKILLLAVIISCLSCAEGNDVVTNMNISCLFVNKRSEEILIRRDNEIIICFLKPEEQYLWKCDSSLVKSETTVKINFKFYIAGPDSDFTKYIGEHLFSVELSNDCVYSDTCYVQ